MRQQTEALRLPDHRRVRQLRGIRFRWNADKAKLRMPEDVVTDMKRIAPLKGFSGYQTLMRAYVGAGLREDMERFEGSAIGKLIDKLRESGVPEETLIKAASEVAKLDG